MGHFDGKVVVVTGAGGGLGRTHALAFAAEGAKVVVNDLGGARDGAGSGTAMADQVVAEIRAAGGTAVANYDSVAERAGAEGIIGTALREFGGIDILVNNAGILRDKTLVKLTDEMFDLVVKVHLRGTYLCGQVAAKAMIEQGRGGRIINTSSLAGLKGNFGQTNYAAAKAGIYGMTLVWGQELMRHQISVTAVAPVAKTRMTEDIAMIPDDMKPEQVTKLVLFLASDHAEEITGRTFGVHGQHLFEYKMETTEGVKRDAPWTIDDIHAALPQIAGEAAATPAATLAASSSPAPAPAAAAPSLPQTPADQAAFIIENMPGGFVPAKAGSWKANIVWEISGAGDFTVNIEGGQCTTHQGKVGKPTCVVKTDVDTFLGVATGSVNPQRAFMAGKITATNLGDMMKYQTAFDRDKGQKALEAKMAAQAQAAPAAAPATSAAAASAPAAATPPSTPAQKAWFVFQHMPAGFRKDKAGSWRANIVWEIAGAGDFTVTVDNGKCTTHQGKVGKPTCVVKTDADTFLGIVDGSTDAQRAYMAGKITATNLGDMMKYQTVFDRKKAEAAAQAALSAPPATAPTAGAPPPAAAAAPSAPQTPADQAAFIIENMPAGFVPERAGSWTANIVWEIAGAGDFTVNIEGGKCTTHRGKVGKPTCVVKTDVETFNGIALGTVDPQRAFMSGKVTATNLGDMMKYQTAFSKKKAEAAMASRTSQAAPAAAAPAAAASAGAPAAPEPAPAAASADDFEPIERVRWIFSLAGRLLPSAAWRGSPQVDFRIDDVGCWRLEFGGEKVAVTRDPSQAAASVIRADAAALCDFIDDKPEAGQAVEDLRLVASKMGDLIAFGSALRAVGHLQIIAEEAQKRPVKASAEYRRQTFHGDAEVVLRSHALDYAKATNDDNPRYRSDHPAAPPLLGVRYMHPLAIRALSDPGIQVDLLRLVHGEQKMIYHRPLRPRDVISPKGELYEIEHKEGGTLIRYRYRIMVDGEISLEAFSSYFVRGSGSGKSKSKEKTPKGPAIEAPEWTSEMIVRPDQSRDYAQASLDDNPIHVDDGIAKAAGFKGVILHGLCTMAFAGQAVVEHCAGGDPERLLSFEGRFSKPVFMEEKLTTRGRTVAREDGKQTVELEVINQDGTPVFSLGRAVVRGE